MGRWNNLPILALRYQAGGSMTVRVEGRDSVLAGNHLEQNITVDVVGNPWRATFTDNVSFDGKDLGLRFYGWVLGADGREYNRKQDLLQRDFDDVHIGPGSAQRPLPFEPRFVRGPAQGNVMNVRPGETLYLVPNPYEALMSTVVGGDVAMPDRCMWAAKHKFSDWWMTDWLFQIMLHELEPDPLRING